MKTKLQAAVEALRHATRQLRNVEHLPVVPPKLGRYFETLNGSLVYICKQDSDGDAIAVVLKGGHKIRHARGEEPGERYYVRHSGCYASRLPGPEWFMSLSREVDPLRWKHPDRSLGSAYEGSVWTKDVVSDINITRAARGLESVIHMRSLVADLRARRRAKVWS